MKAKDLKHHEKQYWHIRKFSVPVLPIIGLIVFSILSYLNAVYLISKIADTGFGNLELLYPAFAMWIFGAVFLLSVFAVAKGEYGNLKSIGEEGIIYGLIFGLICSLILGLIYGLIIGFIFDVIGGLICGLITGLIGGLTGGLFIGLIIGIVREFG